MAQFIKEFEYIDNSIQQQIEDYVRTYLITNQLEQSQLYSPIVGEKFIDTDKRSSKYIAIKENELFTLCNELIQELNRIDNCYSYHLVKNDITYIKYQKGDFFAEHEDYLSLKSNIIEEFTLIICISNDNNLKGGRTSFKINQYFIHNSTYSSIYKCALLFRKDLTHSGQIVTDGIKEILTMNLWGVRKQNLNEKILVVKFNKEIEENRINK